MAKKKPTCSYSYRCEQPPFRGGFCAEHYAEDEAKRLMREACLDLLHHGEIDGARPTDPELLEESKRLWDQWGRVCNAVNFQRFTNELPEDEERYYAEWCILIAGQIIEAERAVLAGKKKPYRQFDFWENFENLAKGLQSNGQPRRK